MDKRQNEQINNQGHEDDMTPDKDPTFMVEAAAWAREMAPTFWAASVSFGIAVLRIVYEDGRTGNRRPKKQILIESMLCGGLTIAAVSLSQFATVNGFKVPVEVAAGIGGAIGFLGVDRVRALAERFLDKKLGTTPPVSPPSPPPTAPSNDRPLL